MEKEVGIAASLWDRRATSDRKWILPIKLGDCAIPAVPLNKSLSLPELHWIRLEDEGWDDSLRAIADIVLQRARERAWQALCEAAETLQSAERARAESMAFAIKCEFNEASKTELARSETLRMERRNDFSKALSAHFSKYKDDYNPLIEMDMSFEHIVVEARKEHESLRFGCMIAGLVFILICGLVAFLAYWIACGIRKFC